MSDRETINFRYMPTLANGHIGFTPFDESIYMNGLFNGEGGECARIGCNCLLYLVLEIYSSLISII